MRGFFVQDSNILAFTACQRRRKSEELLMIFEKSWVLSTPAVFHLTCHFVLEALGITGLADVKPRTERGLLLSAHEFVFTGGNRRPHMLLFSAIKSPRYVDLMKE